MGFLERFKKKVSDKVKDTVTEQTRENIKEFVKEHKAEIIGGMVLLIGWGAIRHENNRMMKYMKQMNDTNMANRTTLAAWDKTIDADMAIGMLSDEAKIEKITPFTQYNLGWAYQGKNCTLKDPGHNIQFDVSPIPPEAIINIK